MRKTRRLRQKQRGGKFIGAGTYGCGFRPALRCAGETRRRSGKFAKLMSKRDADEELSFREILQPRDPHQQYFLYPEEICTPAPYKPSDEVEKCDHDFSDLAASRVIIMGKGGQSLENLRLHPRDYLPFFRSLRNLFRGLIMLHRDGIAHMDVKPPNIVARRNADNTFHTRLIDFGLMVDSTRLDTLAKDKDSTFYQYDVFRNDYLYWPFEVRLAYYSDIAAIKTEDLTRWQHNFYRTLTAARKSVLTAGYASDKLTTMELYSLIDSYDYLSKRERYKKIFSGADVYGLGISLGQIYYRFTGHRDVGDRAPVIAMFGTPDAYMEDPIQLLIERGDLPLDVGMWHQLLMEQGSIPLYHLVRAMTHKFPERRPTMEAALAAYEAILSNIEEGLEESSVAMAIKPWMLNDDVLIEGSAVASARTSSSISEVPPSPVAAPVAAAGGAGARAATPPNLFHLSSNNVSKRVPALYTPEFTWSSSSPTDKIKKSGSPNK